jgi:DNA polymerase I
VSPSTPTESAASTESAEPAGTAASPDSRPLLIIDGDNLAHRAYHSTPKTVTGANGAPINAIVGFVNILLSLYAKEQPRAIFVAWDTLGVPTYRHKLWPQYQGGRVFDPEIIQQLGLLPGLCEAFKFGVAKRPGSEADDLMAAAALQEVERGGTALLLTTDRDSYQLVSSHITVLSPSRGSRELDRITPEEVIARLGVRPDQVPDYKALAGDSSDKIPGARGIGPKTAASLLATHGTLDAVLTTWPKPEEIPLIRTFQEIVTLRPDVPITLPPSGPPDWQAGADALRHLGATTLADRLIAQLSQPSLL